MPAQSFQEAWGAYEEAIQDLYRAPTDVVAEAERSAGEIYIEKLQQRGDILAERSADVRTALEASLQSDDLGQRELAGLKLIAAAAHDLSMASEMYALETVKPGAEVERGAFSAVLASPDLRGVLDAPMETGIMGLVEVERAALPVDPAAARAELEKNIKDFLSEIPDEASGLSQKVIGGVINLGLGPAQAAASLAVQEILARIPEGLSLIARKAAVLVVEAIQKLRTAWGKEQEQQAMDKVKEWLDKAKDNQDAITELLDTIYETQRIQEEVNSILKNTPATLPASQFNQATQSLQDMLGSYGKTKGTLNVLMSVLAFAKTPLMGSVPWGPLAVYVTYVGIFGYAVYSGGDYLDWYRTGETDWLDRVKGLRATVRSALEIPAETAASGGATAP
jgi:hypothetical protein